MKKILLVLAAAGCLAFSSSYAQVSVGVRIGIAPPPLPVYVQPACPVDGYLWEPGYWAYDNVNGYYWVPGVWIAPPDPGLLWTPSYWGYDGGYYAFHAGYWGPHVGFYGGINYGFGYPGVGFYGGAWSGRSFRYNTAVFNVNRTVIRNTYVSRVGINPVSNSRASFNGRGGVVAQPRPEERQAMNDRHVQATRSQLSHQQMAGRNPQQRALINHGAPHAAAMNKVNGHSFNQQGLVAKVNSGAHTSRPANSGALNQQAHTQVNRQQNNINRTISNTNHNGNNALHQQRAEQSRMQQRQPQQMQQHAEQPRMQQRQPQMQQRADEQPHTGGGGRTGGGEHMSGGGGGHMGGGGGGGHERR
jgi:hypothetical protein